MVLGRQQRDSAIHTHVSVLPQTSHHCVRTRSHLIPEASDLVNTWMGGCFLLWKKKKSQTSFIPQANTVDGKESTRHAGDPGLILGRKDTLEKGMALDSSTFT